MAQEVLIKAPRDATAGWLYASAYRGAIDRLRARERRAKALRGLAASSASFAAPSGKTVESPFDLDAVRERLRALDEPYRSALSLRYLEELDFPAVAKRLGTIERTARTWVARGLERLREGLEVRE